MATDFVASRLTRHQLEAAADHLAFDALAADAAADVLAEFDYEVRDVPGFDLTALPLAEFEAAITPAGAETATWAPVVDLSANVVFGRVHQGKSTGILAALYGFGEVA